MSFIGVTAEYATMEVLPAGSPVNIKDWDQEVMEKPGLWVTDAEQGALLEAPKAQLILLLEEALRQAKALPDDPGDAKS